MSRSRSRTAWSPPSRSRRRRPTPRRKKFQTQFASGVADVVVGKPIEGLTRRHRLRVVAHLGGVQRGARGDRRGCARLRRRSTRSAPGGRSTSTGRWTSSRSARVRSRIAAYDAVWSRFRDDSVVARMSREPGTYRLPDEAGPLLDLYAMLGRCTDGAVSPLVGTQPGPARVRRRLLAAARGGARAGAGVGRRARARRLHSSSCASRSCSTSAPRARGSSSTWSRPSCGTAASSSTSSTPAGTWCTAAVPPFRVALQQPGDPTRAIGVVELDGAALCGSAVDRRAWGDGLHHVARRAHGRADAGRRRDLGGRRQRDGRGRPEHRALLRGRRPARGGDRPHLRADARGRSASTTRSACPGSCSDERRRRSARSGDDVPAGHDRARSACVLVRRSCCPLLGTGAAGPARRRGQHGGGGGGQRARQPCVRRPLAHARAHRVRGDHGPDPRAAVLAGARRPPGSASSRWRRSWPALSKFVIAVRARHVLNPAAAGALVAGLLAPLFGGLRGDVVGGDAGAAARRRAGRAGRRPAHRAGSRSWRPTWRQRSPCSCRGSSPAEPRRSTRS